ncbi:serine hydrolase FSH [Kalaharituber pfeilii]|nr:serine hydrolase FSH [Kalaharituber pfeilii]
MPSPVRILTLHGYTQSAALFRAKTKSLEKYLQKWVPGGVELVYVTAPIRLRMADLPGYMNPVKEVGVASAIGTEEGERQGGGAEREGEGGEYYAWWRKNEAAEEYTGLETTCWDFLRNLLAEQGPFDGALGFSQGAALAAILASLLEPSRLLSPNCIFPPITPPHPPLKFAVCYSGFIAPYTQYSFLYNPKINTPILHFIGEMDTVVEHERTLALVRACEKERVLFLSAVARFIVECAGLGNGGSENGITQVKGTKKQEESVEDMDVPF